MPSGRTVADALSLGNAGCGLLGLLVLITPGETGAVAVAAALVFAGWALDAVDGAVARGLQGDRAVGVVLDSLCDVVTFGALPATLAVAAAPPGTAARWITGAAAAAFLAAVILRLRRYTTRALAPRAPDHGAGRLYFEGLPAPAAAMTVASAALASLHAGVPAGVGPWLAAGAALLTAPLMLSALPYADVPRHLARGVRPWAAIAVPVVAAPALGVPATLVAWFAAYLASGPLVAWRRVARAGAAAPAGPGAAVDRP